MSDIVARAKEALKDTTEGPWNLCPIAVAGWSPHYGVSSGEFAYPNVVYAQTDYQGYGNGSREADAEFIAAARELVPDLIAEVERLRAIITVLEAQP